MTTLNEMENLTADLDRKIPDHDWFVRGPYCWGTAPTLREALLKMRSAWSRSYAGPRPHSTDPTKWTLSTCEKIDAVICPTGPMHVDNFDGHLMWYVPGAVDENGDPVEETIDHDPDDCGVCTLKSARKQAELIRAAHIAADQED